MQQPTSMQQPTCRGLSGAGDAPVDGRVWTLKRNCSLSPRQLGLFYLSISLFSMSIAIYFLMQGIWLILPFTVLELVILAMALLIYARHAGDYDRIALRQGAVIVESVRGARTESYEFNACWLRVESAGDANGAVRLAADGKAVAVGQLVGVRRRQAFARELAWWLGRVRKLGHAAADLNL